MKIKLIGGCLDQGQREFPDNIVQCESVSYRSEVDFNEYYWFNTGLLDEKGCLIFFYIGYEGEFAE